MKDGATQRLREAVRDLYADNPGVVPFFVVVPIGDRVLHEGDSTVVQAAGTQARRAIEAKVREYREGIGRNEPGGLPR